LTARYRFAEFALEPAESRLTRGETTVAMQPKVFDALVYFAERPGRLIAKQELIDALWPGIYVTEESLTQVIRKLRLALGDDPQSPRFVETVARRGYRFLPAVDQEPAPPGLPSSGTTAARVDAGALFPRAPLDGPEPVQPAARVEIPAAASPRRWSARRWAGVAAAVGALVALGWWLRSRPADVPALRQAGQWRLTSTAGRETYPALAPDGRRYAFVLRPPGEAEYDLYAAAVGGAPMRLTATAEGEIAPQFSPDGRQILFGRESGARRGLWRVSALGGAPALVVDDADEGAWSADGRAVLYAEREPGGSSIVRRRELATSRDVELWRVDESLASLAVSPDGERLAAVAGERQILVGPASAAGVPRAVVGPLEYVRSVAWMPDGRALVTDGRWPGQGGNLMRVPLDGAPPQPLTAGSSGLFHPTVDRRGRVLHAREHKRREVVRLDARLRRGATLPLPTSIECFDVAPDGSSLAVSDWDPPSGRGSLALLAVDDGAARPLGDGLCPAYSPDGARLAHVGASADDVGLWVLELGTRSRRRVGPDRSKPGLVEKNAARRPAWSPDGRQVAYVAGGLPEGDGVFVIELATSRRRLLAPGLSGQLAWSPDGRWLAVSGDGASRGLVVIDVASRTVRRVHEMGNFRATPVWLDRVRVAFLVDQQTRPQLLVVDAPSGRPLEQRPLPVADEPSFWGVYELVPDRRGGWLAVVETYESDLYLLGEASRQAGSR
jgi:DNA-binding winged helix-turn-helix (wHTH) protein/Tol biopolymer transport system component